jgi:LDH2 family malate/lactate/ureidoglycolate dehydrogenase
MYKNFDESSDNGHFFIVINIGKLMPIEDYYARMESFITLLRASGLQDQDAPSVILPGEIRWEKFEENRSKGLTINSATTVALQELAGHYQVALPTL